MKDQGEVHVCGTINLDLADVSPRRVVCSPEVDGVIAGCQREAIRLSEMYRLSGDRNASSQNDDLVS
jgi:hypothetical protein